jgi:hypothetical protein
MSEEKLPSDAHPFEVLAKANRMQPKAKRIEWLKRNADFASRTLLQLNFSDDISLDLPEGAPPYRKLDAEPGIVPTPPFKPIGELGLLVPSSNLTSLEKENKFIEILESLHPKDAELVIQAKEGKLTDTYPNITKLLMKEVAPNLIK